MKRGTRASSRTWRAGSPCRQQTDRWSRNVSLDPKVEGRQAVEAQYAGLSPMRRIGDPVEAAAAVVWLCSDAASFVTGHSMIVDGGMTAATR